MAKRGEVSMEKHSMTLRALRIISLLLLPSLALDSSVALAQEAGTKMTAKKETSLPQWSDYANQIRDAGEKALATQPERNDAQTRQEAAQAFVGALSAAYLMSVYSDPDYPEFVPMWNMAFNVMGPVPDTIYSYTQINGAGVYRIRGFRNTVRYVELTVNEGNLVAGTMKPISAIDLDDIKLNPDTSFEIMLSQERPKDYAGNWIKTTPQTTSLLVRSQSYDWMNEKDGVMAIERVDAPTIRPRPSAEKTAARLAELGPMAAEIQGSGYGRVKKSMNNNLYNNVEIRDYVEPGAAYVKRYLEGLYDLKSDEALIIETEVPKVCRYWSAILLDTHKGSIDWVNHQSSINGFQAKLDKDGKFRAVIALSDPGVANWLDPAGLPFGVIQIRWDKCDSKPTPSFTKVKLVELKKHLPKDMAMVTPEARDKILRDRRMASQLRRKW